MALVVNNVTIPNTGNVIVNGVQATKVVANNVTVWEKLTTVAVMSNGAFSSGYGSGYGWRSDYDTYSHSETPAAYIKGVSGHTSSDSVNTYVYTGNLPCSGHGTCSVAWDAFTWGATELNKIIEISLDNAAFAQIASASIGGPGARQNLDAGLCVVHSFSISGHANVNIRLRLNGSTHDGGNWFGIGFKDITFN